MCRAPGERRPAASHVCQESPGQGHGISARERRVRGTPEAETATGRVRQEASPLVDAISMCAAKAHMHQERSRRDKKRKKCSKGLDNCGHIEGLYSACRITWRMGVELPLEKVWNRIPYHDRPFHLLFQALRESNPVEQSGLRGKIEQSGAPVETAGAGLRDRRAVGTQESTQHRKNLDNVPRPIYF